MKKSLLKLSFLLVLFAPSVFLSCSDDDDDNSTKDTTKTEETTKLLLTGLEGPWMEIGVAGYKGVYFANSVTKSIDSVLFMDYIDRIITQDKAECENCISVYIHNGKEYSADSAWAYQFDYPCTITGENRFSYHKEFVTEPVEVTYTMSGDTLSLTTGEGTKQYLRYKGREFLNQPLID